MFSIITPTFNRKEIIQDSIDSSLLFIEESKGNDELIIVDDASTDKTYEFISNKYEIFFNNNMLVYKTLPFNQGVTYAKNYGALNAKNEWLVFLDSDDQLLPNKSALINSTIASNPDCDVFFFRCVDNDLKLVGNKISNSFEANLNDFIRYGTHGECLPVIKKATFLKYQYDADLRGFEGLSYLRMLISGIKVIISKDPVRKYSMVGEDRLSTQLNLFKRSDTILSGYIRYLKESHSYIAFYPKLILVIKILKYLLFSFVSKFSKNKFYNNSNGNN